jgi:hypothetical protein
MFNHQFRDCRWRPPLKQIFAIAASTLLESLGPAERFSDEAKNYDHLGRGGAVSLRLLAQKWRIAEAKSATYDPVFRFIGDGLI